MSSVVVQVGQCGNQIGEQLWKLVEGDPACQNSHAYQSGEGKLRSVHVDSEPKVVQRLLRGDRTGRIRAENVVHGRKGRGSNWAMGYHGLKDNRERHLVEDTVEAVRKEAERCECFSGIIMMHSMSGGTGSGLGSRLCEEFRDEFGISYLMSCVVAPHVSGEAPLQNYNALLCLSSLQKFCDGIVLFHNDEVLYRLQRRYKSHDASLGVSYPQMNEHIAACLGGMFLPIDCITPKSGCSIGQEPWEMLRSVCPVPSLKFAHVNSVSKSKLSWENLTGLILHTLKKHDQENKPYRSLANLVAVRGDTTGSFPAYRNKVEERLRSGYHCVEWNPFPIDFWTGSRNSVGKVGAASMTVASNYSNITELIGHVWSRAQEKYSAKAYLHWYWKYGSQQDDFEEAFHTLEGVVKDYGDAIR